MKCFGRFFRQHVIHDPLAAYSHDDIESAALRILYPLPDARESWIGGTLEECDAADKRIEVLRGQYATYEPKRMRMAIFGWLDYATGKTRKARQDIETTRSLRELDDRRKKESARQSRIQDVLEALKP